MRRSSMRKKMLAGASVLALILATSLAGGANPVAAHSDHTSCAGGVVAVIEGPGYEYGEDAIGPSGLGPDGVGFIAPLATAGVLAIAVDGAHQFICMPN
jgi:hypothetical protein